MQNNNQNYKVTKLIGAGSFGEIWMGVGSNGKKAAIKFERQDAEHPQLRHEYKVYRELHSSFGFCSVYHFGTKDNYNILVMDLLGPSLEDLLNICNRKFSLKTVLQIADQLLERVETLHERHLIHRDIKPANFTIGLDEDSSTIFCVDFGLAKRFRDPRTLQHSGRATGKSLTGTPRYASIKNHQGIGASRRDDLESICYMLIYFLKGRLPWQGIVAKTNKLKYRQILAVKEKISITELCADCPVEFAMALSYARNLKFDAEPNIPYLRRLFRDLYFAENFHLSRSKVWDWDGIDTSTYMNKAQHDAINMPPPLLPRPPIQLQPKSNKQPHQQQQQQMQVNHNSRQTSALRLPPPLPPAEYQQAVSSKKRSFDQHDGQGGSLHVTNKRVQMNATTHYQMPMSANSTAQNYSQQQTYGVSSNDVLLSCGCCYAAR